MNKVGADLPTIPDRQYFSISMVSELCQLKPHVLRYWEQKFMQLKPMKGASNQRYYKKKDILLIRRIKSLLYAQGYTIEGARLQLAEDRRERAARAPLITSILRELKNIVETLED